MRPLGRLVLLVLALMLSAMQYRLWSNEGGIIENRRLQSQADDFDRTNVGLQKRNAVLDAEVTDLRAGGQAIEAQARSNLGMVKKGETFYLVVAPNSQ